MEAKEFVKKFGWEISRAFVKNWSSLSEDYGFNIDDLKTLVDAWELVESLDGIDGAKLTLKLKPKDFESAAWDRLKQAIELVESCQ